MSKYLHKHSRIYIENTDIPINKLNISDSAQIHAVEEYLMKKAYETFPAELTPDTKFDENYFKSLHGRTFSQLYEWAGEYRTDNLFKDGSVFCRGQFVAEE